jgi:hypothetical protein
MLRDGEKPGNDSNREGQSPEVGLPSGYPTCSKLEQKRGKLKMNSAVEAGPIRA